MSRSLRSRRKRKFADDEPEPAPEVEREVFTKLRQLHTDITTLTKESRELLQAHRDDTSSARSYRNLRILFKTSTEKEIEYEKRKQAAFDEEHKSYERTYEKTQSISSRLHTIHDSLKELQENHIFKENEKVVSDYIEYELDELFALTQTFADVFTANKKNKLIESTIQFAKYLPTQRTVVTLLIERLQAPLQESLLHSPQSLILSMIHRVKLEKGVWVANRNRIICLEFLGHFHRKPLITPATAGSSKTSPAATASLDSLEPMVRKQLMIVYTQVMTSSIGDRAMSDKIFSFFLSLHERNENARNKSWQNFLEDSEVAEYISQLLQLNIDDVAIRDDVQRYLAVDPISKYSFVRIRQLLTKTTMFGGLLDGPNATDPILLENIGLCVVTGHGKCELVRGKEPNAMFENARLRTSPVPTGMTVYYFTDAISDLAGTFDRDATNVSQLVPPGFREKLSSLPKITEKTVVDGMVGIIRAVNEEKYWQTLSLGQFNHPEGNILTSRHIPLKQRGSVLVKKYTAGEHFPYRIWGDDKYDSRVIRSLSDPHMGFNTTLTTDQLFESMESSSDSPKTLVIVDFLCKPVDEKDSFRRLAPLVYASVLSNQLRTGKVIAFAGGQRRRDAASSRRKTKNKKKISVAASSRLWNV